MQFVALNMIYTCTVVATTIEWYSVLIHVHVHIAAANNAAGVYMCMYTCTCTCIHVHVHVRAYREQSSCNHGSYM